MAYRPQMASGGLQAGVYPVPSQAGFVPQMMIVGHLGQPMTRIMTPGMATMPGMPPSAVMPQMMVGLPAHAQSVVTPDIAKVPVPTSAASMKVATTVFVGNISEKVSDTLIRQILLRCGQVDGWKRVQDASGKLQGFGFCEYTDPDSTLRALRLLNNLKLGEKSLVAKVDAKTRKELLKYLLTMKHAKDSKTVNEEEVQKEVDKLEEDKDAAAAALVNDVPEDLKSQDKGIQESIAELLKGYTTILTSSKSNEDVQRERDVKESILFMAKQSGNLDANSTLEDMDMEDDMKTLVSDEIKRFRESYQRADDAAAKEKKMRDKSKGSSIVSTLKDMDVPQRRERERARERERERDRSPSRSVSPRRDSQSPRKRSRSSRRSRSRSPICSNSRGDTMDRDKRREMQKLKERERMMKDDEEYEERNRQRKIKERETIYKKHLIKWQERERRKDKEYEKEVKREKERRDDMARERKHLRDFLADYDDDKDDQKYYKGTAYARRYRDRELEVESDERDRIREKDELEELRVKIIEQQACEMLSESKSSGEESAKENDDDDEDDKDVPMAEMEVDIPLTKAGYAVPPAYPPIQVQSAPSVDVPEKPAGFQPMAMTEVIDNSIHRTPQEEELKKEQSEEASTSATNSPSQPKLAFGLKKSFPTTNSNQSSKMDGIFASEDNDIEEKPKKKLVPIDYSDDEMPVQNQSRDEKGREERRRDRDRGEMMDDRRRSDSSRSPKSSRRSRHSSSSRSGGRRDERGGSDKAGNEVGHMVHGRGGVGDGIMMEEGMKDRKLTPEERKRVVQQLVNNIPTSKEEVFKYKLKWNQIDNVLIEKRVKPWINKKIMDYIGEQEPILTDFICNKLSGHISPSDILQDIAMVLDDDAEVFIVKLWRLLIYETEAKHLGIAKNYSEKTY